MVEPSLKTLEVPQRSHQTFTFLNMPFYVRGYILQKKCLVLSLGIMGEPNMKLKIKVTGLLRLPILLLSTLISMSFEHTCE